MTTANKILAFCIIPRTASEIADHCKVQRSSIYSALGRMQMKGIVIRVGDGKERATYVLNEPNLISMDDYENLVIKHAHNPFGLRP
jgi:sugar-specific transcriptional regulator TrmB